VRLSGERGTVLAMMPAAVLILVILAALAGDSALIFLAQRQAFHHAEGAANDAAIAGLDLGPARAAGGGSPILNQQRAEKIVDAVMQTGSNGTYTVGNEADDVLVTVDTSTGNVTVRVHIVVHHIFLGAVPGMDDSKDLWVEATAEGHQLNP
jgi:Flp pilus assembly protein TadG